MAASARRRWLIAVLVAGAIYLLSGIAFGALAGRAETSQLRVAWRLAAWGISAGAFAVHIGYERIRLRHSSGRTALHVALAAALAAFGLAVAANLHALRAAEGNRRLLAIALVAWPVLTAVPAFLVALATAAGLGLMRRSD